MTALPVDLTYGKVVGRFVLAVGDGPDADILPDGVAATGSITLTAEAPIRVSGIAEPITLVPTPIGCGLDEDGYLIDLQGAKGIWLPCGRYRVDYSLIEFALPSQTIDVAERHTALAPLDLTRL